MHFYLEPKLTKCFLKQLPKDTMLVAKYKIEASRDNGKSYQADTENNLNVLFTVEELFDNNHRVANQRGQDGKFIFTALDTGEHKICLTPVASGGYSLPYKSRISLDIETGGEAILRNSDGKQLSDDLHLRNLYNRLNQIKLEYLTFRGREAQFRDMSESVNSSSVKWVIVQFFVLAGICYVQLSMLKNFFIKEKVV